MKTGRASGPVAGGTGPEPVEVHDRLGDDRRRLPDLAASLRPVGAAHAGQTRRLAAGVSANGSELVGWDVKLVACRVLHEQVVARGTRHVAVYQSLEPTDAVVMMNDVVTGVEIPVCLVVTFAPPSPHGSM